MQTSKGTVLNSYMASPLNHTVSPQVLALLPDHTSCSRSRHTGPLCLHT